MSFEHTPFRTHTRVLEKSLAAASVVIDPLLAANAQFEVVEMVTGELMARMSRFIWKEQIGQKTVSYPADWREALKDRFAPEWVKERWPVRYARVDVTAVALFPDYTAPESLGRYRTIVEVVPFGPIW